MAKEKEQLTLKDKFYNENRRYLREINFSMFEYKNLPDTIPAYYFEKILQTTGSAAVFKNRWASPGFPEGSLIVTSGSQGDGLNPYGEKDNIICITKNGNSITLNRYSDELAYGFNSLTETPTTDIDLDAARLTEIDLSLSYLTFYTRLYPLFRCMDDSQRREIETAFKNMTIGIPLTVRGKMSFGDEGLDFDTVQMENITAPDLADKIQYTAKFREDVLRWHLTRKGQSVQSTGKLAQQSVDEVNGTVSASLILPLSMLNARRAFVEEINKKFDTSIEVDFSGAFRAEVTRYEVMSGEGEIDDTGDTPDFDEQADPTKDIEPSEPLEEEPEAPEEEPEAPEEEPDAAEEEPDAAEEEKKEEEDKKR